ncbi:MAG: hypothetical protein LBU46_03555 [Candidatus Accumulibacter sp.]|jgi:hypothetical protein|nr:hypothetical protein [Accumulibacter sp.]
MKLQGHRLIFCHRSWRLEMWRGLDAVRHHRLSPPITAPLRRTAQGLFKPQAYFPLVGAHAVRPLYDDFVSRDSLRQSGRMPMRPWGIEPVTLILHPSRFFRTRSGSLFGPAWPAARIDQVDRSETLFLSCNTFQENVP